jgi:hypothetical protein
MKNLIACLLGVMLILQVTDPGVAQAADKDKDEDRLKECGAVLKEILDVPEDVPPGLTRQGRLCGGLSIGIEGRVRGWR